MLNAEQRRGLASRIARKLNPSVPLCDLCGKCEFCRTRLAVLETLGELNPGIDEPVKRGFYWAGVCPVCYQVRRTRRSGRKDELGTMSEHGCPGDGELPEYAWVHPGQLPDCQGALMRLHGWAEPRRLVAVDQELAPTGSQKAALLSDIRMSGGRCYRDSALKKLRDLEALGMIDLEHAEYNGIAGWWATPR